MEDVSCISLNEFGVGRLLLVIASDRYCRLNFFSSKDSVYGRFQDKLEEKRV